MSAYERQQKLLEVLCQRRHDTCENLAHEFHVTRRTICHDIAVLMCSYPIETVRGFGGGVKIADGYYLYRKKLSAEQIALLKKLTALVDGDDRKILTSILMQFAS